MLELLKKNSEDSYRTKMNITNIRIYRNEEYPVCPRCGNVLDREYMKFCNECGQCLGWDNYSDK